MESGVFLHSPFSKDNVAKGNNRSLLLQFILTQIFLSKSLQINRADYRDIFTPITSSFYPLDWSSQRGTLNKVCEHALLLDQAFQEQIETITLFRHSLTNLTTLLSGASVQDTSSISLQMSLYIKQLYLTLEPLIIECASDENLLLFLLKNQEEIGHITHKTHLFSFLQKNFHKGIDYLCETLCDKFHARGFAFLIPQVKSLIQALKQPFE